VKGRAILTVLAGLLVSGCAFAPVVPPRGVLYTDQKAPLFGGREPGSAEGRASAHSVLFAIAWGDCSVATAARNGGIRQIKHLDYRLVNLGLIYQRFTTIVRGETTPAAGPQGTRGGPR
jgi:hypothetical protein